MSEMSGVVEVGSKWVDTHNPQTSQWYDEARNVHYETRSSVPTFLVVEAVSGDTVLMVGIGTHCHGREAYVARLGDFRHGGRYVEVEHAELLPEDYNLIRSFDRFGRSTDKDDQ